MSSCTSLDAASLQRDAADPHVPGHDHRPGPRADRRAAGVAGDGCGRRPPPSLRTSLGGAPPRPPLESRRSETQGQSVTRRSKRKSPTTKAGSGLFLCALVESHDARSGWAGFQGGACGASRSGSALHRGRASKSGNARKTRHAVSDSWEGVGDLAAWLLRVRCVTPRRDRSGTTQYPTDTRRRRSPDENNPGGG